jgi:hypothetical protein
MMFRKQTVACIAGLLVTITAQAQSSQKSMKGYELYSWKVKSHWYYSLLQGTNRSKSYEEITAPESVKRDTVGLKSELQKLPKGEEVFWKSDAPSSARKSATGVTLNVKHPSRQRIKQIRTFCDKLGIKLRLS